MAQDLNALFNMVYAFIGASSAGDEARHNDISGKLQTLSKEIKLMSATTSTAMDALQAAVAQSLSVQQSAVTLIQGLSERVAAAGTDPQKLADLTASLQTEAQNLATAVSSNTPAASIAAAPLAPNAPAVPVSTDTTPVRVLAPVVESPAAPVALPAAAPTIDPTAPPVAATDPSASPAQNPSAV